MRIQIPRIAYAKTRSDERQRRDPDLRIGIPRVLNQWSAPRFWTAFFVALGGNRRNVLPAKDGFRSPSPAVAEAPIHRGPPVLEGEDAEGELPEPLFRQRPQGLQEQFLQLLPNRIVVAADHVGQPVTGLRGIGAG